MKLDPDLAYWVEMAEARAGRDLFAAAAELPGNPTGAAVDTPGRSGFQLAYPRRNWVRQVGDASS